MTPRRIDERMDATRFGEMADAYGGDVRRWPESERDAARAWIEANSEAERILFDARLTDAALFASPNPTVSMALRDRVLASAAAASLKARATWPSLRRLLWIGGAGWAAAACAGVVFGTNLGGHLAAQSQADAVLEQALLGGFDETEVLG
ncbi:hypothetical protein [Brevundimonas sp. NIBR11]|uniref:hypothetical protein n=1 Tax=Brevundimonas sp. NIBR11 TaxID=3015999 RepID=UPI0022F037FD|nr:hypothetical protein [Brevundimonas sp. NIBR11]WGM32120.1 hypothetical protein KKHFBJBL_02371 [Brevundimonas sp. NIBR11]